MPTIRRYRKKPVVIEAVQVDASDFGDLCEVADWCGGVTVDEGDWVLGIDTLEGRMYATDGDFIIRGVEGEFYPCKPEIFAATYEDE